MSSPFRRIFWAVDPEELESPGVELTLSFLRQIAQSVRDLKVYPVYALSLMDSGDWVLDESSSPGWAETATQAIQRTLAAWVNEIGFTPLQAPRVILQNSSSLIELTRALLTEAHQLESTLILTNTHARKGMKRFFLGSFAETLISESTLPVLIAGQTMRSPQPVHEILYATAFTSHSQYEFRKGVEIAKELHSHLTLYHAVIHPVEPLIQGGVHLLGGLWLPTQAYFGKEMTHQLQHSHAWKRWAKNQGVEVDDEVQSLGGPLAQTILELSEKKKADLILLEGSAHFWEATLLGSIARQVMRNAQCPVLVLGKQQETSSSSVRKRSDQPPSAA